jgi:periplasmic divalent cation tolerance protein
MRALVLSTCGSRKEAHKIARDILGGKLAACVNIVPVMSYYRWKGKIVVDREYLLLVKTRSEVFSKLKDRILAIHSYQLPEIVSLKIADGYEKYLDWIDEEVRARD